MDEFLDMVRDELFRADRNIDRDGFGPNSPSCPMNSAERMRAIFVGVLKIWPAISQATMLISSLFVSAITMSASAMPAALEYIRMSSVADDRADVEAVLQFA